MLTVCDQMETQILRKVQQNYERWQVRKVDNFKDHRQETNGEDKVENNLRFSLLPIYIPIYRDGSARKRYLFHSSEQGFHQLKYIKGQGNPSFHVFSSVKRPERANGRILCLCEKVQKTSWFCDFIIFSLRQYTYSS